MLSIVTGALATAEARPLTSVARAVAFVGPSGSWAESMAAANGAPVAATVAPPSARSTFATPKLSAASAGHGHRAAHVPAPGRRQRDAGRRVVAVVRRHRVRGRAGPGGRHRARAVGALAVAVPVGEAVGLVAVLGVQVDPARERDADAFLALAHVRDRDGAVAGARAAWARELSFTVQFTAPGPLTVMFTVPAAYAGPPPINASATTATTVAQSLPIRMSYSRPSMSRRR